MLVLPVHAELRLERLDELGGAGVQLEAGLEVLDLLLGPGDLGRGGIGSLVKSAAEEGGEAGDDDDCETDEDAVLHLVSSERGGGPAGAGPPLFFRQWVAFVSA